MRRLRYFEDVFSLESCIPFHRLRNVDSERLNLLAVANTLDLNALSNSVRASSIVAILVE